LPVLLVHGANDDATRRYGWPLSPTHPDHRRREGLALHLARRGFAVFAVTFSHYHGCNVHQGQHLANAIDRIRRLTGGRTDGFQVDVVTYSKGAMAARCYVQSAGALLGWGHLTPFRGDVRRVVFQVGPLGGLDTPFRSYVYNALCKSQHVPAPLGARWQVLWARRVESGADHIASGCWPGQLQMLSDLRALGVGYGVGTWTMDLNWTQRALRDGGRSLVLGSDGLDAARKAGGRLVERLNDEGFPREVGFAAVAGTHPVLYHEEVHAISLPIGVEFGAPSDGLLFHASATHTRGLAKRGATDLGVRSFPLNHMDVSRNEDVFEHVAEQLLRAA